MLKQVVLHIIQLLVKPNTNDLFSEFSFVCFEKYSFIFCVLATFYFDGWEIHFKTFKWLLSALKYFLDYVSQILISVFLYVFCPLGTSAAGCFSLATLQKNMIFFFLLIKIHTETVWAVPLLSWISSICATHFCFISVKDRRKQEVVK